MAMEVRNGPGKLEIRGVLGFSKLSLGLFLASQL